MSILTQQVHDFNKEAGLIEQGYDDFLESSFQVEEALEGFTLTELAYAVGADSTSPKDVSRAIIDLAPGTISDVDRLDKACDAVIFAIGSMCKLGLSPYQIDQALNIVTDANLSKLTMPKDSHGKLTKPSNFTGPEPRLQQILDQRS